ncbi:hypothetical protein WMF18_07250 [Sorangium sp. So ce315]|uniref:hypothetical protein n=1 Tax=Sorangium sp. So ce315 TaxID=3133299 RepID=UPI003F5DF863
MPGARVCLQFISSAVGGRATPAVLSEAYRPHFRVEDGEYLGVQFVAGGDAPAPIGVPGVPIDAQVTFPYAPQVNYEPLRLGVQFQVLEGRRIVGVGVITELTA